MSGVCCAGRATVPNERKNQSEEVTEAAQCTPAENPPKYTFCAKIPEVATTQMTLLLYLLPDFICPKVCFLAITARFYHSLLCYT